MLPGSSLFSFAPDAKEADGYEFRLSALFAARFLLIGLFIFLLLLLSLKLLLSLLPPSPAVLLLL